MTYVTLEVEINDGRIVPSEPSKLPNKGKGLLTVLEETPPDAATAQKLSPLEAFCTLQSSLHLDKAKAQAWIDMIRNARR